MKRAQLRSDCPINYSLELFGDTWSLLILRDIVYFGKHTYNEFLYSGEGIARNILAARLVRLQQQGIVVKKPHPGDRRKDVYELTSDGVAVIPVLLELAEWGALHIDSPDMPRDWLRLVQTHRAVVVPLVQQVVSRGGSIFGGELLELLCRRQLIAVPEQAHRPGPR